MIPANCDAHLAERLFQTRSSKTLTLHLPQNYQRTRPGQSNFPQDNKMLLFSRFLSSIFAVPVL
ncbi:DUF6783 domain-containing protein [Fusicatenibacter sp.]